MIRFQWRSNITKRDRKTIFFAKTLPITNKNNGIKRISSIPSTYIVLTFNLIVWSAYWLCISKLTWIGKSWWMNKLKLKLTYYNFWWNRVWFFQHTTICKYKTICAWREESQRCRPYNLRGFLTCKESPKMLVFYLFYLLSPSNFTRNRLLLLSLFISFLSSFSTLFLFFCLSFPVVFTLIAMYLICFSWGCVSN